MNGTARRYGNRCFAVAALVASALTVGEARGQAAATATKSVGLSAFGGVSGVNTEYGGSGYGLILGADATRAYRGYEPSLEARFSYASGDTVTENMFSGALKAEKPLGRDGGFHPYVDVFVGYGTIHFKHPIVYPTGPYASDNSVTYGAGAGLDFDVTPRFAVKGDLQYSRWKLGTDQGAITPTWGSVGVVYRLRFRSLAARHF